MNYLTASRPKFTLWLIAIVLIINIISMLISSINELLILYPSNLNQPLNWYRLITYPFAGVGLLNWLINSIVLILTGFIIESRFKKIDLIAIIIIASIIGGLSYIIFNQNDMYNRGIAGPTMISWGYWAATIVIGIKSWKELKLLEKIVLILCFLGIVSLSFDNFGFLLGQIILIFSILVYTLIRIKK
jgi:membrane associated rhomboid family serine protease